MFTRRLVPSSNCAGGHLCPDILELESGDFAIIGVDITRESEGRFPAGSGCGPGERVVRIPRRLLVAARDHIPITV